MDQFENAVFDRQAKELKELKSMNEQCLEAARLMFLERLKSLNKQQKEIFDDYGQIIDPKNTNKIAIYYVTCGELGGMKNLLSQFGHDKIWETWATESLDPAINP